jgi:hypothetical protein
MTTQQTQPTPNQSQNPQPTNLQQHAQTILQEFFAYYGKQAPEKELWSILVMALGSNNEELDGYRRSTMIYFYEQCKALFQAASLLSSKP